MRNFVIFSLIRSSETWRDSKYFYNLFLLVESNIIVTGDYYKKKSSTICPYACGACFPPKTAARCNRLSDCFAYVSALIAKRLYPGAVALTTKLETVTKSVGQPMVPGYSRLAS